MKVKWKRNKSFKSVRCVNLFFNLIIGPFILQEKARKADEWSSYIQQLGEN
jgi:hypothetical protein